MRNGHNETLPRGGNTFEAVYVEMLLQVCRDYASLPDVRALKAHEILFFYNGLRGELIAHTAPK